MNRQVTYIIILLLFLVFLIKFGNKKGFNMLETYWIAYTLLFYVIFDVLSNRFRVILLLIVSKVKAFYMPIFTVTGVFLAVCGQKFKTYRVTALNLFHNYLNLKMDTSKLSLAPTIYMANYPANYVEYLTHGLFCDKLCIVAVGSAVSILKYIYGSEHTIAVNKGSFQKVKSQIKNKIKEGYSIFTYLEKNFCNRKDQYQVSEIRSGMFTIAKDLEINITPVCIDHLHHTMGFVNNNYFQIKIMDSFKVLNVKEAMIIVKTFLQKELKKMKIPKRCKKNKINKVKS